ncbi:DUF5036 family protein [Bacteroides sp. BFG-551]|nr:DUF5036 family protein [Bacteroides sp. BFG-551]
MNTKKIIGISLLSLCITFFMSCSDDDTPNDPADTITLNMLNEHNGKTYLGESGTYINEANNFVTSSNFISDVGNGAGVGANILPSLTNLTHEVAVTPGHIYQIFDKNALIDFPSGNRAIQVEASYYQAYVVSKILNSDMTIGAIVKYIPVVPANNELPAYRYNIGSLHYIDETVELALPPNIEFFLKEHSAGKIGLNVTSANNKLRITLTKTPNIDYGPYGTFDLYIRSNNVFTVVEVNVK